MELSFYLFATYVFLLLCVTIWLLGRVLRKSKKPIGSDKASYDKEQKLFTLYQNVEDMLASFEEYVQESQSEADKNLSEMKKMLEDVKRCAEELRAGSLPTDLKEPVAVAEEKHDEPADEQMESLHLVTPMPLKIWDEPKRPAAAIRISKTGSKVLELRANGLDRNEIAKKLGVSVREVSLAMKIAGVGEEK